MKIAVPRESAPGETRVALTPQAAGQLVGDGVEVLVQAGAGDGSHLPDEAYREAGATIVPDAPPCTARPTWCCAWGARPMRRSRS